MNGVVELGVVQVGLAYVFLLILLVIVKWRGIGREKEILLAGFRMTLQLMLMGYVLVTIFKWQNPIITIVVVMTMEIFAIRNIYSRVKQDLNANFKRVIAFSITVGTLTSLFYFLFIVVRIYPWYNPQYFIPIAGMLIGNSMTGISLGVSQLAIGTKQQRPLIESALMMGATPKVAIRSVMDHAFDAAIMPTINSMLGMGIVFLPGMMTGQILAGISPLNAIGYQIAIMLGILGSVSLTVILCLYLGYKTFFNEDSQLI